MMKRLGLGLLLVGGGFAAGMGTARWWWPASSPMVRPVVSGGGAAPATAQAGAAGDRAESLVRTLREETRRGVWVPGKRWTDQFEALSAQELGQVIRRGADFIGARAQGTLRTQLYFRWAGLDPDAAYSHAGGLADAAVKRSALQAVVSGWLYADPVDARRRIQRMPDGAAKSDALLRLLREHPPTEELAAVEMLESLAPTARTNAYQGLFAGWAARDPREALARLEQMNLNGQERTHALSAIAAAWSDRDPKAAAAWAQSLPGAAERSNALNSVMWRWVASEPENAVRHFESLPASPERQNVLRSLLGTWVGNDPKGAARYVRGMSPGPDRNSLLAQLASASAAEDVDLAIETAELLPAGPLRSNAMQSIVGQLAQRDPEAALERIKKTGTSSERDQMLMQVVSSLSFSDPELAGAFAEALPAGVQQTNAIMQVVNGLAQQSVDKAATWANRLPPGSARQAAFGQIASVFAQSDPAGAARWAASLPDQGQNAPLLSVMGQWIQSDPDAALAWAGTLPDGALKRRTLENAAMNLAHSDPERAFTLASQIDAAGGNPRGAMNQVAFAWAMESPEKAMARAAQLPAGAARDAFQGGILSALSNTAPATAAKYVGSLPAGEQRQQAVQMLAAQWVYNDPQAAVRWAGGLDASERERAIPMLAGGWTTTDPAAAGSWLAGLPPDESRDRAYVAHAEALVRESPQAAARAIDAIANPQHRIDAVQRVARLWMQDDRSSAQAWLATQDLPEEVRRGLLN